MTVHGHRSPEGRTSLCLTSLSLNQMESSINMPIDLRVYSELAVLCVLSTTETKAMKDERS